MAIPPSELRRLAITRHVIYVLVAAAVVVPLALGLTPGKFEATPYSHKLFDKVNSLPPGTRVLLSFDFDPGTEAELLPMGAALLRHCFRNRLVPLVMTNIPSGVDLARKIVKEAADRSEPDWGRKQTSGVDYVFLGYRPGDVNLLLNMGENLKGAFQNDYYGKPTEDMPALKDIRSLKDLPLVIDLAASAWVELWIVYGADRFNFAYGAGVTAVMGPDMYPFLQSGQMVGMLNGLRGAADYEVLLEKLDRGTFGMMSQSVAHVLVIVLVLAANARFVYRRLTGREKD
ncbi:MAG TPA: hypothetical protein VM695_07765 [Phycisphaerae bacterium]|nr:hypothetical protein [Phycisphaerae bacterium]